MNRKNARQILAGWLVSYPSEIPDGLSIAAALSLVEHVMAATATKGAEPDALVFGPAGMRDPSVAELEAMRVVFAGERLAREIDDTPPVSLGQPASLAADVLAILNGKGRPNGAERSNEKRGGGLSVRQVMGGGRVIVDRSRMAKHFKFRSAAAKHVGASRHALARAIKKAGLKPGATAMVQSAPSRFKGAPKVATFIV